MIEFVDLVPFLRRITLQVAIEGFIWKFLVFCTWMTFDLFLRPRSIYRLGIHPYEF